MNTGICELLERASERADGIYYIAQYSYYGIPTLKLLFLREGMGMDFLRDAEVILDGSTDLDFVLETMMKDAEKRNKQAIQDHYSQSFDEFLSCQ
jgi:hypothetical protein